jgi:hypothetical protein
MFRLPFTLPQSPLPTHKVKTIGPNTGAPTSEASLDIEYLTSMGSGVPSEFWSFAGTAPHDPEDEPFLAFMLQVVSRMAPHGTS